MEIEFGLYDPELVKPMREEVVILGFKEILTADNAQKELKKDGYSLVFVNSVCGCAAGKARPGLKLAIEWAKKNYLLPDNLFTVFAGMERTAVKKVREFFKDNIPTSPQIALLFNGNLMEIIQRSEIENSDTSEVSEKIIKMLKNHIKKNG